MRADTTNHDIALYGCTPEPLMAYLKALGVLRLVGEQKDPDARGWWRNDMFLLRSALDADALVSFFLEDYVPTPIVAPWAGGSGFFRKDNKKAVDELGGSESPRLRSYTGVIDRVRAIIEDERVGDKPRDEDKVRLIRRYRRDLPDEAVAWIDAAMVLQEDGQVFAPLLGTGGNDGRLDFTQNFMQRIVSLGLHRAGQADPTCRAWLGNALFANPVALRSASIGQFAPGRAGGPNATQGMEGDSSDNPWDFVLMIEGTLLFAGAVVRRLDGAASSRPAFPFTVRAIVAGYDSPAAKDGADSRGELWLPLWSRRASVVEIRQLLGEGRAEISGRPARDGADFARAATSLGIDRGISGFKRFAFLKRSGKAYLAAPIGRFDVTERYGVDLLRQVDHWLSSFRRAAGDKEAPPRFASSVRRIDSAVFEFCKCGGARLFQEILVALGAAERVLATAERFRKDKRLRPLAGLSPAWAEAADDGTLEFAAARAVASIRDPEARIGPLRANLEPVDWSKRCAMWAEKDRVVVWNSADLTANLASVLQRRMMDGQRAGCEGLPLASRFGVPLDGIAAFLAGDLDDRRTEELIWGLMLISDRGGWKPAPQRTADVPLPRAYVLLKLLFLPRALVTAQAADGTFLARLRRYGEQAGVAIKPEPSVLPLLRAGRLGEACATAMRRLRASGLDPMPGPIRGRGVRDCDWRELDGRGDVGIDPLRLAAALLIPIRDDAVSHLMGLVIHGNSRGGGQAGDATGMNLEGGSLS